MDLFLIQGVDEAEAFILRWFDWSGMKDLYARTPELGETLNPRIQARTPVWAGASLFPPVDPSYSGGALRSSETFDANTDPTSNLLVHLYPKEGPQIAAWGRTYARFIEGPSLGEPSPTISSPAHMYARVASEDLPLIEQWAAHSIDMSFQTRLGGGSTP